MSHDEQLNPLRELGVALRAERAETPDAAPADTHDVERVMFRLALVRSFAGAPWRWSRCSPWRQPRCSGSAVRRLPCKRSWWKFAIHPRSAARRKQRRMSSFVAPRKGPWSWCFGPSLRRHDATALVCSRAVPTSVSPRSQSRCKAPKAARFGSRWTGPRCTMRTSSSSCWVPRAGSATDVRQRRVCPSRARAFGGYGSPWCRSPGRVESAPRTRCAVRQGNTFVLTSTAATSPRSRSQPR